MKFSKEEKEKNRERYKNLSEDNKKIVKYRRQYNRIRKNDLLNYKKIFQKILLFYKRKNEQLFSFAHVLEKFSQNKETKKEICLVQALEVLS